MIQQQSQHLLKITKLSQGLQSFHRRALSETKVYKRNKYWDDLCQFCGFWLVECKCPGGIHKNFSPENLSKLTDQDLAS